MFKASFRIPIRIWAAFLRSGLLSGDLGCFLGLQDAFRDFTLGGPDAIGNHDFGGLFVHESLFIKMILRCQGAI